MKKLLAFSIVIAVLFSFAVVTTVSAEDSLVTAELLSFSVDEVVWVYGMNPVTLEVHFSGELTAAGTAHARVQLDEGVLEAVPWFLNPPVLGWQGAGGIGGRSILQANASPGSSFAPNQLLLSLEFGSDTPITVDRHLEFRAGRGLSAPIVFEQNIIPAIIPVTIRPNAVISAQDLGPVTLRAGNDPALVLPTELTGLVTDVHGITTSADVVWDLDGFDWENAEDGEHFYAIADLSNFVGTSNATIVAGGTVRMRIDITPRRFRGAVLGRDWIDADDWSTLWAYVEMGLELSGDEYANVVLGRDWIDADDWSVLWAHIELGLPFPEWEGPPGTELPILPQS